MEKKWNFTYKITNLINGKYYYGCHSTNDIMDGYMGCGKDLWKDYHKYGKENFEMIMLENFLTSKERYDAERKLITNKDISNPMCYNLVGGGDGGLEGYKHSKDSKKKISEGNKGKIIPEHQRKIISELRMGVPLSSSHKKSISNGLLKSKTKQLAQCTGIYITPIGNFSSSRRAAEALGVSKTKILTCCRKPQNVFSIHSAKSAIGWFRNKRHLIGLKYIDFGFGCIRHRNET